MNWYFAAGDLDFFWKEQIRALSWLPQVFRGDLGFGENSLVRLWIDYPFRLLLKLLSSVGLSWFVIEKLLWISVFVLAICCAKKLASHVFGKNSYSWLASLIYATNTYILLLFGGGQLGVAWAYAFTPLVLSKFIETIDGKGIKYQVSGIRNGLWLVLLITFDLRFAYLMVLMVGLYAVFRRSLPVFSLAVSFIVAGFIHSFWIVPFLFAGGSIGSLGEEFVGPGMLKFLSVADFSHAISLLHPNWPENLFGKVYFMQPEFLLIPLFAFGALLFREQKMRFFALLGLVGAFLAKGAQPPFGEIFTWMFSHVPGFVMFRDPTKFYLFVAIAYVILIPYVLKRVGKMSWILFVIFWIFTLRPLFLGQLTGNFRPTQLPQEYVQLKDLLAADTVPSRTLWIPQKVNYAFYSDTHPVVSTGSAFVEDPSFSEKISQMGVKYVIVPSDVNQRIFLTDYQPDPGQRTAFIEKLQQTSLKQNTDFQEITVFENDEFIFTRDIPQVVAKQQQLANMGVALSAGALIALTIWIFLF